MDAWSRFEQNARDYHKPNNSRETKEARKDRKLREAKEDVALVRASIDPDGGPAKPERKREKKLAAKEEEKIPKQDFAFQTEPVRPNKYVTFGKKMLECFKDNIPTRFRHY